MVVVDKLSKAAHFIPVKTTYKDANIADIFLKQIFRLHGIPKVIVLDRDPKFNVVFNPLNRDLQRLPVNLGSRSEIMTFGIPSNQKNCFKKISAIFAAL